MEHLTLHPTKHDTGTWLSQRGLSFHTVFENLAFFCQKTKENKSEILLISRTIGADEMVRHDHTRQWLKCNYLFLFNFFDQEALLIYAITFESISYILIYTILLIWQVTFTSLGNRFIGSMESDFLITAILKAIKVGWFCLLYQHLCTKQCSLNFL